MAPELARRGVGHESHVGGDVGIRGDEVRAELDRLVGIDEHVVLRIGNQAVRATFDEKQFEGERISAVQYVRFRLGSELSVRFADPAVPVYLRVDHPHYTESAEVENTSRASLAADLQAD